MILSHFLGGSLLCVYCFHSVIVFICSWFLVYFSGLGYCLYASAYTWNDLVSSGKCRIVIHWIASFWCGIDCGDAGGLSKMEFQTTILGWILQCGPLVHFTTSQFLWKFTLVEWHIRHECPRIDRSQYDPPTDNDNNDDDGRFFHAE